MYWPLPVTPYAESSAFTDEFYGVTIRILNKGNDCRAGIHKRVFDLMKDFGTSKSTKIDSIFDSLLVPR
ncbi:MAG: hypothetical protein ABW068_15745, partial [Candidatus Thiodiazotropha sp.]